MEKLYREVNMSRRDELIAKIQHFYDIINDRRKNVQRYLGENDDVVTTAQCALVAHQYGELAKEYNKVFENLLYSEK